MDNDKNAALLCIVEPATPDLEEDDARLWTVERLGAYLGKSKSAVYRMAESGQLPYRKLGRALRFIPAEIRTWLGRQPGKAV